MKRGPRELNICETADYTFTILNANADCAPEPVHFTDYLPEGMYWVPGSLVVDSAAVDATKPEPIVMEDRMLGLDMLVRGAGFPTTFRAQAAFGDNAKAGVYYNGMLDPAHPVDDESYAKITYTRKDGNKPQEDLHSTDAYYNSSSGSTDRRTKTVVTGAKTYESITTSMEFKPSACFRQNQEVEVKVKIHNPNNSDIGDASNPLYFETYFNDNCAYMKDSLKIKINGVLSSIKDGTKGVTTPLTLVALPDHPEPGLSLIHI